MKNISLITACIIVSGAATTATAAPDAAHGKALFEAQCTACHTVEPGRHGFGPSLAGVVGHDAGTAAGFKYTGAMSGSNLRWDAKNLDEFLANSTKKVPGTAMDFSIASADDRAAIVAYLATTTDASAAAPAAKSAAAPMPRGGGPTQAELLAAGSNSKDWLYATHDYSGARFVENNQINTKNASQLRPVCIYRSDIFGPTQTNPLVYKGVIYATVENGVAAIDGKTCRARWEYRWKTQGKSLSLANRGAAIKDGVLVRGTSDGHVIALDMENGKLLWSRKIADADAGQYISMPPLMFDDLVVIAPAGADWGPQNWIGAFRIATGEEVWRFYLVPRDGEPGAETWKNAEARKHGGGSVWTPVALDAKSATLYVPVGNPAPDFYAAVREGDNLYTNSVVALDVRTGKLRWYRQFGPFDAWDADLSQVSPIFTTRIGGRQRDVITVSGKDGLLRLMDRDTREIFYEIPITTRTNVDVRPTVEGIHRCPGLLGGMEWNGPAYNPHTGTLFVGTVDWCGTFTLAKEPPVFQVATHHYGGAVNPDPRTEARGWLQAIDAKTGATRWKQQWSLPVVAGIVATSGGVLFTGGLDNEFVVLDAANGKSLYRFNTGGSIGGGVVTYQVDGKQYVATSSGVVSGFFGGSGTAAIVVLALP